MCARVQPAELYYPMLPALNHVVAPLVLCSRRPCVWLVLSKGSLPEGDIVAAEFLPAPNFSFRGAVKNPDNMDKRHRESHVRVTEP